MVFLSLCYSLVIAIVSCAFTIHSLKKEDWVSGALVIRWKVRGWFGGRTPRRWLAAVRSRRLSAGMCAPPSPIPPSPRSLRSKKGPPILLNITRMPLNFLHKPIQISRVFSPFEESNLLSDLCQYHMLLFSQITKVLTRCNFKNNNNILKIQNPQQRSDKEPLIHYISLIIHF